MTEKTFNLKGLSFDKKDLGIITLDELGEKQICPGHVIFMSAKFNRPVLLMRAGDFVDPAFVKKYKDKGQKSFYILSIANQKNIDEFESLWVKLKIAALESERFAARNELLKYFANLYWYEDSVVCALDFYIATFNVFNRLADEIIVEVRETDTMLCERGMQMASLATVVALAIGYTDYEILSDIFHVTFLLDFGLVGEGYSYLISQACDKERLSPGDGITYLKNAKVSKKEFDFFHSHPVTGYQKVFRRCYGAFYNLELMKLISFHHEQHNGQGFPQRLNFWGLSDLEVVPLFIDYIVPFEEVIYQENSSGGLLKKYVDAIESGSKIDSLASRRVKERLEYEMSKVLGEVVEDDIQNEEENNIEEESLDLIDKLGA